MVWKRACVHVLLRVFLWGESTGFLGFFFFFIFLFFLHSFLLFLFLFFIRSFLCVRGESSTGGGFSLPPLNFSGRKNEQPVEDTRRLKNIRTAQSFEPQRERGRERGREGD